MIFSAAFSLRSDGQLLVDEYVMILGFQASCLSGFYDLVAFCRVDAFSFRHLDGE